MSAATGVKYPIAQLSTPANAALVVKKDIYGTVLKKIKLNHGNTQLKHSTSCGCRLKNGLKRFENVHQTFQCIKA
jgi:hypothetical protein